jgi:hypothetical protein
MEAQESPAHPIGDFTQLRSHADTYVVRLRDAPIGTVTYELLVTPESMVATIVQVTGGAIQQHVVVTLDPLLMRPKSVQDSGLGFLMHVAFRDGRIRGTRITWDTAGHVDTTVLNLPADLATVVRHNLIILIPCLPLAPGRVFKIPVFDPGTIETAVVRVVARDVRRITLGSRAADALQVVLEGDLSVLPETVYVSNETPRRILRTERPSQLLVIERRE